LLVILIFVKRVLQYCVITVSTCQL